MSTPSHRSPMSRRTNSMPGGVKILDRKGVVIHSFVYADLVFGMDAGGHMEPEFNDVIPLPDGAKYVSLALYALPMAIGLDAFESEDKARDHEVVRQVKQIAR